MKLTFRDLKQQKFELDAEPTDLISAVKEKLKEEKGWEVAQQKLIYSGKILQDDKTVESYNISGGYIVCMVSKPKAAPAAPAASSSKEPSTPAPATTATPAPPAAPVQSSSASTPAVPATPTPAGSGASQPAPGSVGAERAEAIANLESMGFERSQIEVALRAAFFNADRAVEYLLNGIPENLQRQPAAAPANSPPAAAAAAEGDDAGAGDLFQAAAAARGSGGRAAGAGASAAAAGLFGADVPAGAAAAAGLGNLDFLRNNTQFQQLRQVVQQQPQMLEPILQQVAAGNPQLASIISAHPEQFLQLLGEDGDDDAALPPGANQISVTEEERDAIERLCRLGFDREQAIQAYFACDKNEELAANFLFDQPEEDDAAN